MDQGNQRQWGGNPKDTTLLTYIRNMIHHPENVTMRKRFNEKKLYDSISQMIKLIVNHSGGKV